MKIFLIKASSYEMKVYAGKCPEGSCKHDLPELSIGSVLAFIVKPVSSSPVMSDDNAMVIAFIPFQGFQWCKYHNGSKTWESIVTRQTVKPTVWLRRIKS